jgi:cytochrome c6
VRELAAAALVAAAVVVAAAGCGSVARTPDAVNLDRGRELFVQGQGDNPACGACHVLEAAGTTGTIGPSLDDSYAPLREQGFSEDTMRDVVRGQIAYPVENPATGEPGMPANLVRGEDAAAVASFVARCAGNADDEECRRLAQQEPAPGQEATEGREVFIASCGGCHVLEDAGTTGTVGPPLDGADLDAERVQQVVREGPGAMPSFADTLTDEQIQAVAEYVATQSRR